MWCALCEVEQTATGAAMLRSTLASRKRDRCEGQYLLTSSLECCVTRTLPSNFTAGNEHSTIHYARLQTHNKTHRFTILVDTHQAYAWYLCKMFAMHLSLSQKAHYPALRGVCPTLPAHALRPPYAGDKAHIETNQRRLRIWSTTK